MQTDVSNAHDVEHLIATSVKTYGRLDYACNNAGIEGALGPISSLSEEAWDRTTDINLKGIWLSMKEGVPMMLEHNGGDASELRTRLQAAFLQSVID